MDSTLSGDIEQALSNLRLADNEPVRAAAATNFLAQKSRSDANVRAALADSSTLKLLLDVVESGLSHSMDDSAAALRCIGNACIDNDDARDALTALGFTWALQCFARGDEAIQTLTVKGLFNICSDHEAAQKRCLDDHIHYRLLHYLRETGGVSESSSIAAHDHDGSLELAVDLLFTVCGHMTISKPEKALPVAVIEDLLILPTMDAILHRVDGLDGYAALAETALVFLRNPIVQIQLIDNHLFGALWDLFLSVQAHLDTLPSEVPADPESDSIRRVLIALSTNYTWLLSDTAANKSFAAHYPIQNPLMHELLQIIVAVSTDDIRRDGGAGERADRVTNAACQIIGNLLWLHEPHIYASLIWPRSVPSTTIGVRAPSTPLHAALFAIIIETEDIDVLHSAAGVLTQLTRPGVQCREVIGSDGLSTAALARLCRHERTEMNQDALRLLKALGKDCPANQARFTEVAHDVMARMSSMTQQNSGGAGAASAAQTIDEAAASTLVNEGA